jgi:hypothetical protein
VHKKAKQYEEKKLATITLVASPLQVATKQKKQTTKDWRA